MQPSPTMSLSQLLRSSLLVDLGLLVAAGFAAGGLQAPWAWSGLLAASIAVPRLALAHRKAARRRQTLRRLIAQRRHMRQPQTAPPHPLAGLGDEWKAPLNAIISFAALLADERHGPLSPAHLEYVQSIQSASRHMKAQMGAAYELERIREGSLVLQEREADPAELAEVALRLCQPEARAAGVFATLDAPPAGMEIQGDIARLQQILVSLILAACACAPKASPVRISLLPAPENGLAFSVETTGTQNFPASISLAHATALARLHGGAVSFAAGSARFTLPAARVKRA